MIFSIFFVSKWPVFSLVVIVFGLFFYFHFNDPKIKKYLLLAPLFLFILIGVFKGLNTEYHYYVNSKIISYNLKKIKSYHSSDVSSLDNILVLKKLYNDNYSFTLPYKENKDDKWVTPCFKRYYDIPEEVVIQWIDP